MAMNADEAQEMLEKSTEKNVLALIDHELRFLNGRRKAREVILTRRDWKNPSRQI